jgi:hypothetical protein
LLPREDKDVADALLEILRLDGLDVRLNVEVARVGGSSGSSVRLGLTTSAGTSLLEGSDILVAVGRIPNTTNIGLEKTGVALDTRGYIQNIICSRFLNAFQVPASWSLLALLHERSSAHADLLKSRFEVAKLLRAQF